MNYYGKDQCLNMDWDNVKEISSAELAYCIFTHDLDINMVSAKRLSSVKKELIRRKKQHSKEQEVIAITNVLAQYEQILIPPATTGLFKCVEIYEDTDEVIGYILDPTLFQTVEEAELALSELDRLLHREMTQLELNDKVYREPNTRARDIQRLQQSAKNMLNQYRALGGDTSTFIDAIQHIPTPEPLTLDSTIKNELEQIQEKLIKIGISKTKAIKISKSITKTALSYLY